MKTAKPYDITNKMLSELMLHALEWGERHGIDNVAVTATALRKAGEHLEKMANKHGHHYAGGIAYGSNAPPANDPPN